MLFVHEKRGRKIFLPLYTTTIDKEPKNRVKSRNRKTKKTPAITGKTEVAHFVAGAEGLEPSTNGFGDHYSTN